MAPPTIIAWWSRIIQAVFNAIYIPFWMAGLWLFWKYRGIFPIKQRIPLISVISSFVYLFFVGSMSWSTVFDTWFVISCPTFAIPMPVMLLTSVNMVVIRGLLLLFQVSLTQASLDFDNVEKSNKTLAARMRRFIVHRRKLFGGTKPLQIAMAVVVIEWIPLTLPVLMTPRAWVEKAGSDWCTDNITSKNVTTMLFILFFTGIFLAGLTWALWSVKENFLLVQEFRMLLLALGLGMFFVIFGRIPILEPHLYRQNQIGGLLISGPSAIIAIYYCLWVPVLQAKRYANRNVKTGEILSQAHSTAMDGTAIEGSKNSKADFESEDQKSPTNDFLRLKSIASESALSQTMVEEAARWNPKDLLMRYLNEADDNVVDFQKYLTLEFAVENLLFWIDLRDVRRKTDTLSESEMHEKLKSIFNKFIPDTAPMMVNISDACRRKLVSIEAEPSTVLNLDMFKSSEYEVVNLMAYDSFSRFRRTPTFKHWLELAFQKSGTLHDLNDMTKKPQLFTAKSV